jgi:hypothetical protein
MRSQCCIVSIAVGLLLLCGGCATIRGPGGIPLGEWSGRGVYVMDQWSMDKDKKHATRKVLDQGTYPTQLNIERATPEGQDVIRIEILSRRGTLKENPNLGDRTHLVLFLKPAECLADGAITLYRILKIGCSTDDADPDMEDGPAGATLAARMSSGGDVLLRLVYQNGWIDLLRFRGDQVLKDGSYFEIDSGYIHWSEVLHRERH